MSSVCQWGRPGRDRTAWWEEWEESERVSAANMKTPGRHRNISVLLWLSLSGRNNNKLSCVSDSVTVWVMLNISYKCKYSPQFSQIIVLWYYILRIVQYTKPAVINKLPSYNFLLIQKGFQVFLNFRQLSILLTFYILWSWFDILSEIDGLSFWLTFGCLIFSDVQPVPVSQSTTVSVFL